MKTIFWYIWSAISYPAAIIMVLAGTFIGLVFGALPGLSATMAIVLLIPMTYSLEPTTAIGRMIGAYVVGMAGGAVASILDQHSGYTLAKK